MNICHFYILVMVGVIVLAIDEYLSERKNDRRDR